MSIDRQKFYTTGQAAKFLRVTPETVKKYCRCETKGKTRLKGEQRGPKKVWHVPGTEILRVLDEWKQNGATD